MLLKTVRKVHRACPKYKDEPGFFAPVLQAQLPNGEKICKLSFYELNEHGMDTDKAWELLLLIKPRTTERRNEEVDGFLCLSVVVGNSGKLLWWQTVLNATGMDEFPRSD
eukprot:g20307.t1